MEISRRDFLAYVSGAAAALGVDASGLTRLEQAFASATSPPVIWLQGSLCSGCSISLLNLTSPTIDQVLLNAVSLRYHPNVMAASGDQAITSMVKDSTAYAGGFVLVVEGGVPTALGGRTCIIGERDGRPWTMLDAVRELGPKAHYVVSVGTCAAFGGIMKESPYTGTRGVKDILQGRTRNPIVNLPGCPAHPNAIVGTLVSLLTTGIPALGAQSQPLAYYGATVHRRCPRLYKGFVQVGKYGCYFLKGCKGPYTVIDCPVHKWNNGVSWCIQANMACVGCASPSFPSKPLMAYGRANAPVDWHAYQGEMMGGPFGGFGTGAM